MLDVAVIRANIDAVKANCRNRNVPAADPDLVVRLDDDRKRLLQEAQALQQQANELSKVIAKGTDQAKKDELKAEGKRLREQVGEAEKHVKEIEAKLHAALLVIPNLTHPDAPTGSAADDNKVVTTWGDKPTFAFKPKDHVAIV